MHSRLLLPAFFFLGSIVPVAIAQESRSAYNVQVASFPNQNEASRYAARLRAHGENPTLITVDLATRGEWTRVVIGGFSSLSAARQEGLRLVRNGVVEQFLVTSSDTDYFTAAPPVTPTRVEKPSTTTRIKESLVLPSMPSRSPLTYVSALSRDRAPLPNPVQTTIRFLVGDDTRLLQDNGLWLSGDTTEALARLNWIAGSSQLVRLRSDGRAVLEWDRLVKLAGVADTSRPDAAITLADYIASNEGLLLLVQMTEGLHRYCLHIGQNAPTRAGIIQIRAGINLDNNYDSRINPHRRNRKKLECELPPPGYDALVAVNPNARWLNLRSNEMIPPGHIIFHELAEAYAKVELGLDYLATSSSAGAHDLAIERERRLKLQRPLEAVVTAGPNRVFGVAAEERFPAAVTLAGAKRR